MLLLALGMIQNIRKQEASTLEANRSLKLKEGGEGGQYGWLGVYAAHPRDMAEICTYL
jgi:hypothetical protein